MSQLIDLTAPIDLNYMYNDQEIQDTQDLTLPPYGILIGC